jgi:hypothetical protein
VRDLLTLAALLRDDAARVLLLSKAALSCLTPNHTPHLLAAISSRPHRQQLAQRLFELFPAIDVEKLKAAVEGTLELPQPVRVDAMASPDAATVDIFDASSGGGAGAAAKARRGSVIGAIIGPKLFVKLALGEGEATTGPTSAEECEWDEELTLPSNAALRHQPLTITVLMANKVSPPPFPPIF